MIGRWCARTTEPVGACKPDQKPGDVVMPGGFKINLKDAQKLKGLLPK